MLRKKLKVIFNKKGFSLIEFLIYIAIFIFVSGFLVAILTTFTKVGVRQTGENEVNSQINFVSSYIQETVKKASLIDMPENVVTSSILLRMPNLSSDPTLIYATNGAIYVKEGVNDPLKLTNENVKVTDFSATKLSLGGGFIVQVNLSLLYKSSNEKNQFSQAFQFSTARISAATFDSSLYPSSSTSLDLGSPLNPWGRGFFSGDLNVGGTVYAGPGSGATALKANGNIGFNDYLQGLILKSPNGTCFKLSVNNSGTLVTAQASCP